MSHLLALDQSSRCSGWAVFIDGEYKASGTFTFNQEDFGERLYYVRNKVIDLIEQYDIDEIAFEDIQQQQNVQIFKALAQVFGVIQELCVEYKIPYRAQLPSHWRSVIGVKGKVRAEYKKAAKQYVLDRFQKKTGEDEADAICIACATLKEDEMASIWA